MPSSPPPFILQPDGWRGRLERLLGDVGRQRLAIAVIALVALTAGVLLRLNAVPRVTDPPTAPLTGASAQSLPRVSAGTGGSGAGASAATGPTTPAGGEVAVDVVGRVRHPGLVRLAAGSRVVDAIEAAGGATPGAELEAVNLARRVVDGEQIRVPRHGEPVTATVDPAGAAGTGGAQPGVPLDLNTATVEQLDTLPGVGEVTAQRIIAYREAHPFTSVDDLRQVSGIGDRRFEALKDLVTVSGGR
jgi:competence protein ComEA